MRRFIFSSVILLLVSISSRSWRISSSTSNTWRHTDTNRESLSYRKHFKLVHRKFSQDLLGEMLRNKIPRDLLLFILEWGLDMAFGYISHTWPVTQNTFPSKIGWKLLSVLILPSDWLVQSVSAFHSPVEAAQLDVQPGQTQADDEMHHPCNATSLLQLCKTENN